MKINKALILSLQPCQNRLDNYLKFYENKQLTPAQFLGLKHITQEDKMWVIFRLMPKENIALATADLAESVLYIFESKHPNDNRPRKAIEAARGKDTDNAAFYAAAANAAAAAANASSAAYATKAAAASADYSDSAAYAAAAYAAAAAFYAAAAAASADYSDYSAANAAYAADSYTAFLASAASMYASFDAATNAAADAAFSDKLAQEKLNRKICLKYMKERK